MIESPQNSVLWPSSRTPDQVRISFSNSVTFYLFIYKFLLFIYSRLHWVFVAVRGLSLVAASGFVDVRGLLIAVASLVVEHGL